MIICTTNVVKTSCGEQNKNSHHGASGCQVIADPSQDLMVVALTNTHLNTGIDRWYNRLQAIAACTIAHVSTSPR